MLIANAIVKPILTILTLPLIAVTLGLFYFVINIAMLALAEWIAPDFSIDGFWTYVGAVIVAWLVNWVVSSIVNSVSQPPANCPQPAAPDRAAAEADQQPIAAELPRGGGVGPHDPRLRRDPAAVAVRSDTKFNAAFA